VSPFRPMQFPPTGAMLASPRTSAPLGLSRSLKSGKSRRAPRSLPRQARQGVKDHPGKSAPAGGPDDGEFGLQENQQGVGGDGLLAECVPRSGIVFSDEGHRAAT